MKVFVIFLIFVIFTGLFSITENAYGLWWPLSPHELIEQSKTIFVGTITNTADVDVSYDSSDWIEVNGTMKELIERNTMMLVEYTVNVEEYLKNPQESNTMKVLSATVSGVPSGPARISGFEMGDRVIFYLPKYEKQTHFSGQHMPESFKIPTNCNAKNAIEQPRIRGGNSFSIIQDGVLRQEIFAAGESMKFVLAKDVRTLFGDSMDVDVAISDKETNQILFEKTIHVESPPCKWITSAEWEFTPDEGDYRMYLSMREGNDTGRTTSYTGFSAFSGVMSPLKQYDSGVPANKIQCRNDLVLISKYDGVPACVTFDSKEKLAHRGWADPTTFATSADCSTDMESYDLSRPLSDVYVHRLVLFMQSDSTASFCVFYKSNHDNQGTHTMIPKVYTGEINLEEYNGTEVSVGATPNSVSLEKNTKTLVKYVVTATTDAEGAYHIEIDQLGRLPLVVWKDLQSVDSNEIPAYYGFHSTNKVLDSVLLWHEGNDSLKYVVSEIQR